MNLRILLALSILANSTAFILRSSNIHRIPKSAIECDSTIHSVTDIFSQVSECFFKKYDRKRDITTELTALSRECFAPFSESVSLYDKCPIRPFTTDQPSFGHLSQGPLAALSPVINFVDALIKSFLTDPTCFVKSYKSALMNEFSAYAKAQNKGFASRIQLSPVEESNSKENWNNWLNAVVIEITRVVAMHECETKYSETELEFETNVCINEFEIYANFVDSEYRYRVLEKCEKRLGSDCGVVFDEVRKTGCELYKKIKDQIFNIMGKIVKDYANYLTLTGYKVGVRIMKEIPFVEECVGFMRSAFVTETQDWFKLIENATGECASNDLPLDTLVRNLCKQVKKDFSKVDAQFIRSLQTIVYNALIAIDRDFVYFYNICV